jgi:hypothetical protein
VILHLGAWMPQHIQVTRSPLVVVHVFNSPGR